MPEKVDSNINFTIDNSNSCNNCCCWPPRKRVTRHLKRQETFHVKKQQVDSSSVEMKTDAKVQQVLNEMKSIDSEGTK